MDQRERGGVVRKPCARCEMRRPPLLVQQIDRCKRDIQLTDLQDLGCVSTGCLDVAPLRFARTEVAQRGQPPLADNSVGRLYAGAEAPLDGPAIRRQDRAATEGDVDLFAWQSAFEEHLEV